MDAHPMALSQDQLESTMEAGIDAFRSGNIAEAISSFEKILQHNPDGEHVPHVLQNLAGAYCESGNLAKGIEYFERASSLLPGDDEILKNLGMAQKRAGQNDEALHTLSQALGINPYNSAARVTVAQVLKVLGKTDEAKMQFDAVIAAANNEQAIRIAVRELKDFDSTDSIDSTETQMPETANAPDRSDPSAVLDHALKRLDDNFGPETQRADAERDRQVMSAAELAPHARDLPRPKASRSDRVFAAAIVSIILLVIMFIVYIWWTTPPPAP